MLHQENNGRNHFSSQIRLYQTSARLQRPTQHRKFHFTSLQSRKLLQCTIGIQFDLGLLSLHKRCRVIPCLQVPILLSLHPGRLGCKQVVCWWVCGIARYTFSHLKRKMTSVNTLVLMSWNLQSSNWKQSNFWNILGSCWVTKFCVLECSGYICSGFWITS